MNRFTGLLITGIGLIAGACNAVPPMLYGDPPQSSGGPDMAILPPDLAQLPYPMGPYGPGAAGDILADIDLPGYRLSLKNTDSTMVAWEDHLKLSSVRSQTNAKCLWLALDAFW